MFKNEKVFYYVDEDDNVEITTGQIVAETCRPSQFIYGMFGFGGLGNSLRISNFVKVPKTDYIVWSTIFNTNNLYNNNLIWYETIDNKLGVITRVRDISDENLVVSNNELEIEPITKYLVFSRHNSYFMFHGVYQFDSSIVKDGKLTIYYKRVSTKYKYKLSQNLKGSTKIVPTTFKVGREWLP